MRVVRTLWRACVAVCVGVLLTHRWYRHDGDTLTWIIVVVTLLALEPVEGQSPPRR